MASSNGKLAAAGARESGIEDLSHVLALDIGGTKLAAGIVDPLGRTRSFVFEATRRERGPDDVIGSLVELGRRAVAESDVEWTDVDAVGIGCGGPLETERGVLFAPPHLPGWKDVPIVKLIEEAYGLPTLLENDATAAAAGEHRYGAGVDVANMIYLTISTGVGGGAIIDGELYRGACGNGGEFGHVTIDWHGRPCRSCGRAGCLEAYVSGSSIAERALEQMDPNSLLAAVETLTAADVSKAAHSGDEYAGVVWNETVAALACGITSIVNLFEPELVLLGGGVTRAGDQLLLPVRELVRSGAMEPIAQRARIALAELGDRVGVVGAAAIVYLTAGSAERRHLLTGRTDRVK